MFRSPLLLEAAEAPDLWTVRAPLIWDDGVYGLLVVPVGTITDLASIPRRLRDWPAFDPNGRSRRAAVAHDYLYATALFHKSRADLFLRDALLAEGVGSGTAHAFYYAVKWFGGSAWRGHRNRVRTSEPIQ
jgi:hypothetical protein